MHVKLEEHLYKIINGYKDAYQIFLKQIEKSEVEFDYAKFFDQFLAQENFHKCDYYAIYDICQYFIRSLTISLEQKKVIAEKLVTKLISAAEKDNISAQCALMIFKLKLSITTVPSELIVTARRNALHIISKNKDTSVEKVQWANFFMALYIHNTQEDKVESMKYLMVGHQKMNPAVSHFWVSHAMLHKPDNVSTNYMSLKNYHQAPTLLICMPLLFSEAYINLWSKDKRSPELNGDINAYIRHLLIKFASYNQAQSDYLNAYLYFFQDKKKTALEYFKKAHRGGYSSAQKEINIISNLFKVEQEKLESLAKEAVVSDQKDVKLEPITNRDFLTGINEKKVIEIHEKLEKQKIISDSNCEIASIESSLLEEVLNQIETNDKIKKIRINFIYYDIKIEKILSRLEKNKNITSIEITQSRFTIEEYLKIFLFFAQNKHVDKITLGHLSVRCEEKLKSQHNALYINFLVNFVKKVNHLRKLNLYSLLENSDDVKRLFLGLKENTGFGDTQLCIEDFPINNENFLILADILNSNVCFFNLLNSKPIFTEEGIKKFTDKIRGNSNLKHLGLERFISIECDEKIIAAANNLFTVLISETKIESLDLSDTIYYFSHVNTVFKKLSESLRKNRYLKVLNLTGNSLKDNDLVKIAHVFENPTLIECLILNQNNITHKGLEVLARILSSNQNNLLRLEVCDLTSIDDEEEYSADVEPYHFYQALKQIISSKYSKIKKLSFPIFALQNDSDINSLNNFWDALSKNTNITHLELSDNITNTTLVSLLEVVKVNHNIVNIRYHYGKEFLDVKLHTQLMDRLKYNRDALPNQPQLVKCLETNKDDSNKNIEKIESSIKKADKETFVEILNLTNVEYKISVTDDQNLMIEFINQDHAFSAMRAFNSSKTISKISENTVIVPNYDKISESLVLSVSFIMKNTFDKLSSKTDIQPQFTLIDLLSDVRQLKLAKEEDVLCISLADSLKIDDNSANTILSQIASLFAVRQVSCILGISLIKIPKFTNLANIQTRGLINEIKKIINEGYTAYKLHKPKSSYKSINEKFKSETITSNNYEVNDSNINKDEFSSHEDSVQVDETAIITLDQPQNTNVDENITNIPKVECIAYSNSKVEMPTREKFRKLHEQITRMESSNELPVNCDHLMLKIFKHHHSLLNLSCDDRLKNVYYILYHCIRISELTLNYAYEYYKHDFSLLNKSAYGVRSILADRPDCFFPGNIDNALNLLQDHPQSFLTVNRQIILDIFNDKDDFQFKLLSGYRNVVFYKQFYLQSDNPKNMKLPIPDQYLTDPLIVLDRMKSIIGFLQNCFIDDIAIKQILTNDYGASINVNLCAIKGALFLLGHFSRILRDYHNKFCNEFLGTPIVKNNFSPNLLADLRHFFGFKILYDKDFHLLNHFGKLSVDQIQQLATKITFPDYCLLFIAARNMMAHNFENQDSSSEEVNTGEEIPALTIAYLSFYFLKDKCIEDQLQNILDRFAWQDSGFNLISPQVFSS